MSNYIKLTAARIEKKILAGEYASWSGVTRAIGKTLGLTSRERLHLRNVAAKYFCAHDTDDRVCKKRLPVRVEVPFSKLPLRLMVAAIAEDAQLSELILPLLQEAIRAKATLRSLSDDIEDAM